VLCCRAKHGTGVLPTVARRPFIGPRNSTSGRAGHPRFFPLASAKAKIKAREREAKRKCRARKKKAGIRGIMSFKTNLCVRLGYFRLG
jgi:hypothetical protein